MKSPFGVIIRATPTTIGAVVSPQKTLSKLVAKCIAIFILEYKYIKCLSIWY